MQQNYNNIFPELPEHARVWIYVSDRKFTEEETEIISNEINSFVVSWKAHQKSLKAAGTLLLNRCIVLAVDEDTESVSGCSIDSSVKIVKSIGLKYNVDFFNRLNMLILKNGETSLVSYHDLNNHKDNYIYNPNISSLKNLRENWLVKVKDSPFV
jgi:hypothetical protein